MNKRVNFSVAKLLKENGFDKECKYFYDKYGNVKDLTPYEDYKDLYSYDGIIEHYFSGEYDWNSLDVNEGMVVLKNSYENYDEYINCTCSAPTIADAVMWIYDKYKIWISVDMVFTNYEAEFWYCLRQSRDDDFDIDSKEYITIEEAYSAGITKVLKKKLYNYTFK